MRHLLHFLLIGSLTLLGCTNNGSGGNTQAPTSQVGTPPAAQDSTATTTAQTDDWRAGDSLMAILGPLQGKVVADMFAGDGYYTWKLLNAGARVLALDDNPDNIAALEARKKSAGIGDDRLLIRLTQPGVPGLLPDEVDLALITREYSQLGNRPAWFAQLMKGVRAPRTFFLVNFLPAQSPVGPPLSQRMQYNTVMDELTAFGYWDTGVFYKSLPYRYVLFGAVPAQDLGGE